MVKPSSRPRNWPELDDDEKAVCEILQRHPTGAAAREIVDEWEEPGRRKPRHTRGKGRQILERLVTAGFAVRTVEHPSRNVTYSPTARPANPASFPVEQGGTLET